MKTRGNNPIEVIEKALKKDGRLGKRYKTMLRNVRRSFAYANKEIAERGQAIRELKGRVSEVLVERNKRFDEAEALREKMRCLNDLGKYLALATKGAIIVVTDAETKWKESKR